MIAFLREVSAQLARCELTHLERIEIDIPRAQRQHQRYASALAQLGVSLEWLPPLSACPDGVFVEDTAVVLPELAVITRPGAPSRRGEVESVAAALARHRPLHKLVEPACLDGGDVLLIGHTLYVGASARTNAVGVEQLARAVAPFGYDVRTVEMHGCLHLKSAVTFIPPNFLLVNPSWVDPQAFGDRIVIGVDEHESFAANTLTVGGSTLVSAAFPYTEQRLGAAGVTTHAIDISELQKAEAALTCPSLLM